MAASGSFGNILVGDQGMTLYIFEKDTPNTSNCYDKCATNWPPLVTTGDPVAGDGIDASKLGTTQRTDGSMQVTYNGWPLYYYSKDKQAGDVVGQGVGDVWFLIAPDGSEIKAEAAAPQPVQATQAPTSAY
jgi:predicted lipoprotein with Yx(FWY)xxD motif